MDIWYSVSGFLGFYRFFLEKVCVFRYAILDLFFMSVVTVYNESVR